MRYFKALAASVCLLVSTVVCAAAPVNFLFATSSDLPKLHNVLKRPDIAGVQIVYVWKELEKGKGQYDFSVIEADLAYLQSFNKKMFIQIQDRFFNTNAKNVPAYLMDEKTYPEYQGGVVKLMAEPVDPTNPMPDAPPSMGEVATKQWVPAVQQRYQALLQALAAKFDGRIYGINLPETANGVDPTVVAGFSCDRYFEVEQENALVARRAFKKSLVVQYVNFWPCEWNNDHQYMSRFFAFAAKNGIGVGGPDVVPYRKGQMKNAYPFFHRYKGQLPVVAMAIQEPTLGYINPQTKKHFTKDETVRFAEDYLGANLLFWTVQAPWVRKIIAEESIVRK